jgi:predicted nucleic acid-binding Zn ribbon protein
MRDASLRECPKDHCRLPKWGHGKVKRLLGTGAGIIFKGSGFYSTDYRSKAYQEAAKKETPPASPSEGTAAAKESKTPPAKPAAGEGTKSKK